MGEEGRFQELVMKNTETFTRYGVKKVIVHCAHCFNTFKNEYPEFGGKLRGHPPLPAHRAADVPRES